MADLKRRIEAMEVGSEEREMGVREWRRLNLNGSARYHGQTPYLSSEAQSPQPIKDKSFLTAARAQLDADHFGLEKIKKRLIEYLAVVRLKELNAEHDSREEEARKQSEVKAIEAKDNPADNADKMVVPYDKNKQQPSKPSPTSVPVKSGRLGKKGVKGPILL
ncbi:hypothetical protein C0989_003481 [Termitomyces sp. Mn162]|nr:hypothetical protein C0989_003481 [Termitomyces sp. Mn162]